MGEPLEPPSPYWVSDEGDVTLYHGDCLDVLRTMEPESVDAIVTDPPAAVSFMGREWDSDRGGRDKWVGWLADRMEAAARVLKPGGHLLVWSLPRTSHWTAWALEDAGLEIRDCVLHLFGSGFPKSLDVSKAIDKAGGQSVSWFGPWLRAERERRGISSHELCERGGFYKNVNHGGLVVNWELGLGIPTAAQFNKVCEILDLDYPRIEVLEREVVGQGYRVRRDSTVQIAGNSDGEYDITAPATEAGRQWAGFGTALKPGQEMWWLARKPPKGTVAANVLQFGTGALNIAACRVEGPAGDGHWIRNGEMGTRGIYGQGGQAGEDFGSQNPAAGRWPANIVFTHSASCEMTGTRRVKGSVQGTRRGGGRTAESDYRMRDQDRDSGYADADGMEVVESWSCDESCPVAELDRQSGVRVSGSRKAGTYGLMGYQGADAAPMPEVAGDTGGASRFYPVFRYQAKAPASERPRLEDGSAHETVKPLGLIIWLVKLITPPGGTVLDMFAGSGPVGEAAIVEGFNCILIEQDPKSAELIKTRLAKPIQPVLFGDLEAS